MYLVSERYHNEIQNIKKYLLWHAICPIIPQSAKSLISAYLPNLRQDLEILLKFSPGLPKNDIRSILISCRGGAFWRFRSRSGNGLIKGKPSERLGRKITGLRPKEGYGSRIAGQDIRFTGETELFRRERSASSPLPSSLSSPIHDPV
jgi:hypothetical protein